MLSSNLSGVWCIFCTKGLNKSEPKKGKHVKDNPIKLFPYLSYNLSVLLWDVHLIHCLLVDVVQSYAIQQQVGGEVKV